MKQKLFSAFLLIAVMLGILSLTAQEEAVNPNNKVIKGKSLETYLTLVNHTKTQPANVLEICTAAYDVLSKDKNASFFDLSQDQKFTSLCQKSGMACTGGPMLGCVSQRGVSVWVRTLFPGKVAIRVDIDGKATIFGPAATSTEGDLCAIVPVTGLKPGNEYFYTVLVDGKDAFPNQRFTLRTVPDGKAEVRVAYGCDFHRTGAANMQQAEQIIAHKPYAILLGGDNCVQDRDNDLGMHRADYFARDMYPAWQKLAAALPIYAQWDDHDYFNNDKWGIPKSYTDADRRNVRKVFLENWMNPYGGISEQGIYFTASVGLIDYIVIDHRYFRDKEKRQYLGEEQMNWLFKVLKESKAPFKILAGGTMWVDEVAEGKDSWPVFEPDARKRLYDFIEKEKIPGVVFASGDRHGARVFTILRPSGFLFYEFNVGSMGGRGQDPSSKRETGHASVNPAWKNQLFGTGNLFAFGLFTASLSGPEPTLTYQLIGEDGKVLYELKMSQNQLTGK